MNGSTFAAGQPCLTDEQLGGHDLRVTQPSGRAHTHGADDGRTGWKLHAVKVGETVAACGLKPKLGWGGDLFEDEMDLCARCAVKLGACKKCKGSGRLYREVSKTSNVGETCPCRSLPGPGRGKFAQHYSATEGRS